MKTYVKQKHKKSKKKTSKWQMLCIKLNADQKTKKPKKDNKDRTKHSKKVEEKYKKD